MLQAQTTSWDKLNNITIRKSAKDPKVLGLIDNNKKDESDCQREVENLVNSPNERRWNLAEEVEETAPLLINLHQKVWGEISQQFQFILHRHQRVPHHDITQLTGKAQLRLHSRGGWGVWTAIITSLELPLEHNWVRYQEQDHSVGWQQHANKLSG